MKTFCLSGIHINGNQSAQSRYILNYYNQICLYDFVINLDQNILSTQGILLMSFNGQQFIFCFQTTLKGKILSEKTRHY